MRVQIAQIDHSMYPPRPPIQDDVMSITTNQLEEEHENSREDMDDVNLDDQDEENRPEDFSPRLWQLFNRIQRRGTEPLFPADWQVVPGPPPATRVLLIYLVGLFEYSAELVSYTHVRICCYTADHFVPGNVQGVRVSWETVF